jgi:hypothetical protein
VRLATITMPYLGWACGFTDFDNDGKGELWAANGHVYPEHMHYRQPFTVFRNDGGTFSLTYTFPATPNNSYRGGCTDDFNNRGKLGVVVVPTAGAPLLFENRTATSNSWIGLRLRGTRSNRDAIGASVRLEACGTMQFDTVRNGDGYISHNDPRLHFGLSSCTKVDRVKITWPLGSVQVLKDLPVNRYSGIEEPR